jgi:hypothetical protein
VCAARYVTFFSFFLLGGFGLSPILSYKYIRNQIGVLFILDGDEKKNCWTKFCLQDVLADDDLTVRGMMGRKNQDSTSRHC